MAFKRTPSPKFSAPVVVNVPNEAGGFDKGTFTAIFKRPTSAERADLAKLTHEQLVRSQLVGWDMKDDETKADVPFTEETLDAVLLILPTPLATAQAFWDALNGAHAKNL